MCHYSLKIASPQCYVCHAGMVDAAVPIKGDGLKGRGGGGIDRIRHDRPIQDA
jgi:ligand-binding sensor protein